MTRIRSRTLNGTPVTLSRQYTAMNGGTCAASPTGSTITQSWDEIPYFYSESMEDVETPKFYRLRNSGGIINSPMKKTKIVEETPPVTCLFGYRRQLYQMCYTSLPYGYRWVDELSRRWVGKSKWGDMFYGCPVSKYIDALTIAEQDVIAMQNLAVTQAWSNIDHSEILALAAIAESGKTYASLTGLMGKALRIIRAFRKRNLRALKREASLNEIKNLYMEARYSLRPLYYDVNGLLLATKAKKLKLGKDRFTFRGKETFTNSVITSTPYVNAYHLSSPGCTYNLRCDRATSISVNVRAGVLTKLDLLTNANIYGFNNLAETAWELVPFSFIVDWFANVGKTIGSWTPNIGSTALASWVTTEIVHSQLSTIQSVSIVNNPPSTGYRTQDPELSMFGQHSKTTVTKERVVNPLRQWMPQINVNLSAWKILDLGIIAQMLFTESSKIRKLRI